MSTPSDIWRAYCSGLTGAIYYIPTGPIEDDIAAAVGLGAIHGRLGEGFPLSRAEVLAEVASLCGEAEDAAPEEDDANEAWLKGYSRGQEAERKSVIDRLEAWAGTSIGPGVPVNLPDWIAAERKRLGGAS